MFRTIILTISDSSYYENKSDLTGKNLKEFLEKKQFNVNGIFIVPDEKDQITKKLIEICDDDKADLIITNGGTGFSKRDVTPEATLEAVERLTPGITEHMRREGLKFTDKSILSRAISGIRKNTLIINLPGSPKAAIENLESIVDVIPHGLNILLSRESDCAHTKDLR